MKALNISDIFLRIQKAGACVISYDESLSPLADNEALCKPIVKSVTETSIARLGVEGMSP